MFALPSFSAASACFGQIAIAVAAIGTLALAPPATGHMTLIALDGRDDRLAAIALGAGALPIAHGRLPGSLVVDGSHDALAEALAGHAIFILAAPEAICGTADQSR